MVGRMGPRARAVLAAAAFTAAVVPALPARAYLPDDTPRRHLEAAEPELFSDVLGRGLDIDELTQP